MKFEILYDKTGRMRIHACRSRITLAEADVMEYYLRSLPGISEARVYDRTCDALILYSCDRKTLICALSAFAFNEKTRALVPEHTPREMNREYEAKLVLTTLSHYLKKLLLPLWIRQLIALAKAVRYVAMGLRCLWHRKIEVPVLDATAITVSLLRGDFSTASSIMFLLHIGEIMEEWTHRKSVDNLANTMSLGIDKVWLKVDDMEVLTPVRNIAAGDCIVVRTGNVIPLDGRVYSGEMTVNQAAMTGEPCAISKSVGSLVYAGTVVEDGECVITVEKAAGSGRYDRIVKMIEETEKLKSETEDKAAHLADKLVPYSLGATALTYLITRNPVKALAILMVDYSCALKLAMPVTILSAMREANFHHISFKGGKFIEAVCKADTIVFDKTGTLTRATPKVARIVTFGEHDESEVLRVAACLEEHYPHSIAHAVVREAEVRGISHEECHSSVSYIVAHGILGTVNGNRVSIGSYHYIFEDEKCTIPDQALFDSLPNEYSHLYMAENGILIAVILIEDPLKEEASDVIKILRQEGFSNIVMMTGDSTRTARAVAARVGVDRYFAEVLPEDKANFVHHMQEEGHKVIMIGDGINDAPALSAADAGIAVSTGAAIAREIADITITSDDLYALVTMKRLANMAMSRIHSNYRFIMSFNTALILLGVSGILAPAASALLHNISTLGIGIKSMTNLLDVPTEEKKHNQKK